MRARKPRLNRHQREAFERYERAVREEDRYLGSVFVTPIGQRQKEAITRTAYEECKRLGMGPEHGL